MNKQLKGLFPPLVLPLDGRGQIDFESLGRQVEYLVAGGADGIWLNGTTGDFFALTDEESAHVVEAAVKQVAGRVPVVAQVGEAATRRTVARAERALQAKADHLAVVLPYYVEYSARELEEHFRLLQNALGRPLIVYQIPQMCKVSLPLPNLLELARDGIVTAVKESSGDMAGFRRMTGAFREENLAISCMNGSSALMDVSLAIGADGLVCTVANLVPHLCKQLYQRARSGDGEGATALQNRVSQLLEVMRLPGRPSFAASIAVYKWLLCQLGLFASDQIFAPLGPLTKSEQHFLREGALPMLQEFCAERASADSSGRAGSSTGDKPSAAPEGKAAGLINKS